MSAQEVAEALALHQLGEQVRRCDGATCFIIARGESSPAHAATSDDPRRRIPAVCDAIL